MTTLSHSSTSPSNPFQDYQEQQRLIFASSELEVFHLKKTVESTQEEAKRLLSERHERNENAIASPLAVIADNQSNGRGTNGRSWVASTGNLYLTLGIPMEAIPMSKITLLPLGCGIVIANTLINHSVTRPTLKWPNDVLLDGLKIAGTLIENCQIQNTSQYYWLIGIGVNVMSHPELLTKEKDDVLEKPRSATCLQRHSPSQSNLPSSPEIGVSLAKRLTDWTKLIRETDSSDVVDKFKSFTDFQAPYTLRDTGETVIIQDIQLDGQLKIVGEDGKERLLVADYFH